MDNPFYNDWDRGRLAGLPERQIPAQPDKHDHRSAFEIDRDRIIHSAAFRRLQSKTQVFQPGEYDFYRTRLTHSIEVAQIGRSLARHLSRQAGQALGKEAFIDADLVEAVCLAHDLGHPPFGHAGERCLNDLMRTHGGFEGNAQTLRILTSLFYDRGTAGMHPTRALLDGVMKYKALRREYPPKSGDEYPENHFLYDEQEPLRTFVLGSPSDTASADETKSLECQIMDWADDTAYSLNDIVDGVNAGFIDGDRLDRFASASDLSQKPEQARLLEDLIRGIRDEKLDQRFGGKVGEFIDAVRLEKVDTDHSGGGRPPSSRYAWKLVIDPAALAEAELYKKVAHSLIFHSPQIQQLEFKAWHILGRLFEALFERYVLAEEAPRCLWQRAGLRVLPAVIEQRFQELPTEMERARLLCDTLSGLTDHQAVRLYRRLFNAEYGSIVELV